MITTEEKQKRPASLEKDSQSESRSENVVSVDSADKIDFGGESALPPPPTLTPEQEKRLWRKIDLHLMPILTIMYLFSFLDRGNIGNARLQGLTSQLHLVANQYNIALTMYFVPYCIFECPANLVLKRFRPSKWLPGITVAWGIVMTLMGIVKNYPQLVAARVCLGVAEAGLFPGIVYYLSIWYPRYMLQYRVGLIFGAASLAGAFSGLLAFGISFMAGTAGLLGWSWIFILEGIATVVVGIVAFFVLVDFPVTAVFLTPEERAFVIWKKKYDNSSVGEEERFAARHVWAAFKDWQVYVHILVYWSIITPLFGITLFLPTIINALSIRFGHSAAISQLLTVPPYVVATIVLYCFAHYSDKFRIRSPFILAGLTLCLIGFVINISNVTTGVKYFGTFLIVTGSYAAFPGVVSWLGNNLAGQYKRGVGMAVHIGVGNFGGAIASNIYRSQDSPRYILGREHCVDVLRILITSITRKPKFLDGIELMFVGIGFIAVPLAMILYWRINKSRDAMEREALERGEKDKYSAQELRELGDRAPDFRYTL